MKKLILPILLVLILVLSGCGSSKNYYKNKAFMTDDANTVVYETAENCVNWGKYQQEKGTLTGNVVELFAENVYAETEEEFVFGVQRFKDKLDVLEIPYAAGYDGERANRINIQIDGDKIGLPVLALLNVNSSYDNSIVSSMGDFRASGVESLEYTLGEDNRYIIKVGVPQSYKNEYVKYCAENVGKPLYLKLGDMTFSSTVITEQMSEESIDFTGLCFLGKNADEARYEMIMKLADYVVNKEYTSPNGTTSFSLKIEGEALYGIPYITELDQQIVEAVTAIYPDVKFERRDVENHISFFFENSRTEVSTTKEYLHKVEDIYKMCNFDDGAYSYIYFGWSSMVKKDHIDSIYFSKTGGKMICYPGDRIEGDVSENEFLKSHLKEDN